MVDVQCFVALCKITLASGVVFLVCVAAEQKLPDMRPQLSRCQTYDPTHRRKSAIDNNGGAFDCERDVGSRKSPK